MDIRNLTLDQVYDIEAEYSASVGNSTAVFLKPKERGAGDAPVHVSRPAGRNAKVRPRQIHSELRALEKRFEKLAASLHRFNSKYNRFSLGVRKAVSGRVKVKVDHSGTAHPTNARALPIRQRKVRDKLAS